MERERFKDSDKNAILFMNLLILKQVRMYSSLSGWHILTLTC